MANPSGRIAGPIRWHIYREPQPPNTRMALGSILTKPDDLETSLNYEGGGIEEFPQNKREDCTPMVRRIIKSELSKSVGGKLSVLLPTMPWVNGGGGLGAERSSDTQATFEPMNIRAQIISPDTAKEYMNRALLTPKVLEYVRGCLFTKPLYLIVGVATCKNLTGSETRSVKRTASADVSADVMGAQLTGSVLAANEDSVGGEYVVDGECDFAYRVREFQYSRTRKIFKKSSDVTDGAMFGLEDEDSSDEMEDDAEEVPEFEYFEDDDENIESTGFTLEGTSEE
ncbi:uncharacterized protein F4822DRAFT_424753 [Hypoxylon trugodes]|uniref:uncharacterized protein n=1 Tax=Hypoxylon trugodes TaxID=326681 RepID=UPI0021A08EBB|nr:uncharacterized protein F4822DRAFT_424753 [Hypoxylon trugodes]KAI1394274.1 hypothetical protein F4822DRAFT_424753 [Hypoxylon trugodes]